MPMIPMMPGGGQGGPPPGPPGAGGPPDGPVTMYTQAAIQALHDGIAHEEDPEDKVALSKALQIVLQVQQKNAASQQQGGPQQALAGRLGG